MRYGLEFRLLGALVYGFVGYELGVAMVGTYELTSASAPIVWGAMFLGAALGYLLSPWIVIAPARAALSGLRGVPISDLVSGTLGLALGLLLAALLAYPISRLPPPFGAILPFVVVLIFGYLGTAVVIMRKEDFYSFFGVHRDAKVQVSGDQEIGDVHRLLLDTSVIIDGRIADIADTGFLLGQLMVPRFVLNELQYIADSSDAMRRNRGRRGLEILDRLQQNPQVEIEFYGYRPSRRSAGR